MGFCFPETLEKEHAMQTLKKSVALVLALEEKLQSAFNENAKLKLMQKEDEKLSIQTLGDQLTESLQHLVSQVQEENSGVSQLVPPQILSKDGKPYIMNCETKVFPPEEITDKVLTTVKEARRVCMSKPFFEGSSSDDTNMDEDKKDPATYTAEEDESDEDINKALYEGGDPDGIMMDCPDIAPLLQKLPEGFEYPFLTNEIARDLLDEMRYKMVMEALPPKSHLMLFQCLSNMFIYWRKKSVHLKQYLTSRSRRKRVLVAAGIVRNQLDHLLCWAYSSSDSVSASLVIHGVEKDYFPLCPMYLCENVDPTQLKTHVIEEKKHRCYGSNVHSALLYIMKYGIPKEKEASKDFNCMLARGVGVEEKKYYISGVFKYPTLEAALMRLKTHPVCATLAMFTGCTDKGIYRGPLKEGSEYMGDHEVLMVCLEKMRGEMVVKCKSSYGKKCCNRGYIYVSVEVMMILAGARRKRGDNLGDICHIRPQYLLSEFYSVDMEMGSDENREKNRQYLVKDDKKDQLPPDQNSAEKKKSATKKKSASPVIWSSEKSSALGNDFLPRGSGNKSLSGKAKVPFHVPTIKKPQEEFNILVNNSNQPFEHVWLERSEDNQRVMHPLEKLSVIDFVGNIVSEMEPVKPLPLEETPFKLVQDVKDLKDLVAKLRTVEEFAVDLEHNQYRSFQGLTCLMQISTRTEDYIVDTFKLRVHIGPYLREIFKDPKKRKVMHGADRDIVWLQRDFGIYVCNLFDTGQASRVLNLERNSLEFLLQHFCGVTANKEYQNADWRIRPLPKEMTRYAREDTHYLLYIYDVMRVELQRVAKGDQHTDSPLLEVYKRSYDLCTQLYEKELLTENSYLHIYGLQAAGFGAAQLAIVAGLCEWRDYVARAEDESTGYVLPNKLLLEIAKEMPVSVAKLRRLLKSKHPYIERNVDSVVSLIKHSMQNCAAFESAALSLKDASPGTVMDTNIEPLSERKDMYIRTEDVASPNLKENSLQVENNISGLVTVAADASERKGLGTGLFGSSAKVPAAVLISKKPSSGLGALLGSSASKKKFRTDKNVNEEGKLEQIRSSVNLQFHSFTDKSSDSKSAPEELSTTLPASISKQHGVTVSKDDSEEASEIVGTSDRVSDAEVSCFETENVILLDDGGEKEVDAEDEPMSLSELSTNFQKCFNSMNKSNNKAQKPEFLNIEPFDYEAARKEVTFGEGQKGRQGGKKEGGSKAGGQKKGSAPEQSEFGQGKRRQAFPASGNRSATFKN